MYKIHSLGDGNALGLWHSIHSRFCNLVETVAVTVKD